MPASRGQIQNRRVIASQSSDWRGNPADLLGVLVGADALIGPLPGESGTEQPSSDADTVLFFLRKEKEKNGVAKPRSLYIFRRVCYNKTSF